MEVPILDKDIDDWGNDEQEKAYDKLQQLKQDFGSKPTKLYIKWIYYIHILCYIFCLYYFSF
jgi:hypothetical protein